MAAGGKAHRGDALGIDIPLPGILPDEAKSLAGLLQRQRPLYALSHAVLKHKGTETLGQIGQGHRLPFPFGQPLIGPAGANEHRLPGRCVGKLFFWFMEIGGQAAALFQRDLLDTHTSFPFFR